MRLDLWLDIACLFKTRSEAQKACRGGKIDVNGQVAKPHREIKIGDALLITRPLGRKQRVTVRGLAEQHLPKAEARELYTDLTPPLTTAERDALRIARVGGMFTRPRRAGAPDKRERRELRKLKERG
jgi:ribosome-associated heat shock protein Hsp15